MTCCHILYTLFMTMQKLFTATKVLVMEMVQKNVHNVQGIDEMSRMVMVTMSVSEILKVTLAGLKPMQKTVKPETVPKFH